MLKPIRELLQRNPDEEHRASTPLELLFDLVTVIAISAVAQGLHKDLIHADMQSAILHFGMAFFSLWWSWNLYVWFASGFDNDDVIFRLLTFTMISGALLVAADLHDIFDGNAVAPILWGYMVMRIAYCLLWLRAAYYNPSCRKIAVVFIVGQLALQCLWVWQGLYLTPGSQEFYVLFMVSVCGELLLPIVALRFGEIAWHPGHLAERFGLLMIIVLGELLVEVVSILQGGLSGGSVHGAQLKLGFSTAVLCYTLWWLYFRQDAAPDYRKQFRLLQWSYAHALIFAAGAALSVGVALVHAAIVEIENGVLRQRGIVVMASAIFVFLVSLWLVRERLLLSVYQHVMWFMCSLVIAVLAWQKMPVWTFAAALLVLIVALCHGDHMTAKKEDQLLSLDGES